MRHIILIVGLLLSAQALQANQVFEREGAPPLLVELYTSEGCSSCPPADRYLSSLLTKPGLWETFIPLAFHVDYWDYIGWPDRFAQSSFKQRQYDYRKTGRLKSVYTPGWVVDGKEWRGFFRGKPLPTSPNRMGGKLTAELKQNNLVLTFEPKTATKNLTAHVALLGFDQESLVTAGENRGKTLQHQFVVLNKQEKRSESLQWQFEIPDADALHRTALAIWITQPDMHILQATAGWIED